MAHIVSSRNGIKIGLPSDTIGVMKNFSVGDSNKMVIKPISQKEYNDAKAEYAKVMAINSNKGGFVDEKSDIKLDGDDDVKSLTVAKQESGEDQIEVKETPVEPVKIGTRQGRMNKEDMESLL